METQTRLSRHNKFISAENIVGIFFVSSDDSFYMLCLVAEMRMRSYSLYSEDFFNYLILVIKKIIKLKNQKIKIKKHKVEIKLQSYRFFRS